MRRTIGKPMPELRMPLRTHGRVARHACITTKSAKQNSDFEQCTHNPSVQRSFIGSVKPRSTSARACGACAPAVRRHPRLGAAKICRKLLEGLSVQPRAVIQHLEDHRAGGGVGRHEDADPGVGAVAPAAAAA